MEIDSCTASPLVINSRESQVEIHTKRKEEEAGAASQLMTCMEDAPETRQSNDAALIRSRDWRERKEALAKAKGLADVENEFIKSLIYHKIGHSDVYWATVGEVMAGPRRIKTNGAMHPNSVEGLWLERM